ncbi:MAG: hypothetical protein QM802_21295 [Agriterribacter sp.]
MPLLIHFYSIAQTDTVNYNFDYTVMKVRGDLNNDKIEDEVVVTQDTLNEKAPYQLQVFFKGLDGQNKLVATSIKIIEPQYPEGRDGFRTGNGFSEVIINKGVLSVNAELLRGHYEHKFRFQNGNFELIGFSKVSSNGQGAITYIDFNLITGIKIGTIETYDTNKIISKRKEKIMIRPLPKLQDVIPLENDLY